ncbi:Fe-S protein assembly co-chaperone HscB [Perkinsela sp. CCAP 1560/4]|nr:Fe-S protein assembly co-chaperone HscB [Perkinsela sp. CCAP 1560/4]|eukprot:KNH05499.1 Fe-S protein assembly co-chaperone HscB [Perkinsela sp. CCAP 1560/4]
MQCRVWTRHPDAIHLIQRLCFSVSPNARFRVTEDYFSLLDVPRCIIPADDVRWHETIKASYRRLQMLHHPDKVGHGQAPSEKSIRLNAAYESLKDPVKRFRHILQVHDCDTDYEAAGRKNPTTPAFLMEMLELNEKLEKASSATDLSSLAADITKRMRVLLDASQALYGKGDFPGLKEKYVELSYLRSLHERTTKALSDKDCQEPYRGAPRHSEE